MMSASAVPSWRIRSASPAAVRASRSRSPSAPRIARSPPPPPRGGRGGPPPPPSRDEDPPLLPPFRRDDELALLAVRGRSDRVRRHLRGDDLGRDLLLLPPLDLLLLDEDLLLLVPDVDLPLLDDELLLPLRSLELEGDLLVRPFELDLRLRLLLDDVPVPMVLGHVGLGLRVRLLRLLGRLGLRDRRLPVRVRLPHPGVPLDLLRPLDPEGVQVAHRVLDLLDHEGPNVDPHVPEVVPRHPEEVPRCSVERRLVGGDLDLGDGLDVDLRPRPLDVRHDVWYDEVQRPDVELEPLQALHSGHDDLRAARDDA